MSKEAKVGLLLGLALIVGIVLVLRGLHGNDEAKLDEELAISGQVVNPSDSVGQEAVDIPSAVNQLSDRSTPIMPSLAKNDSDIRFIGDLPGDQSGRPIQTGGPVVPPMTDPLDKLKSLTEPVETNTSVVEVVLGDNRKVEEPQKRIYVVEKGENLTKIALRVYGKVEGKKHKNIVGIYEANKDKMPSKDVVYPGQKLVIPRIPGEPVGVKMVTMNQTTRQEQTIAKKVARKSYSVQKDDTLWDIAEAKLGNGMRYKDIMTLNKLKSEDLYIGQKIELPDN